jgi:hypothetical protein
VDSVQVMTAGAKPASLPPIVIVTRSVFVDR